MQQISSAFIVLRRALQRKLGRTIAYAFLVGIMLWAGGIFAQQQTGEIDGRVTDASDAAIPGATVILTNDSRGIRTVTATDDTGRYTLPLLPPAEGYQVSVTKEGFKEVKRAGIPLQVAQTAQVNFALQVGSSTETVVVTGAAPLLDQETSSVGQVINTTTITNLPLNGPQ
jgi:hypothetical protein